METLKRAFLTAPDSFGDMQSGIVYFEGSAPSAVFDEHLHIHRGENGLWHLTIENCQWESRDLAELEAHLREWASDEYPDFPAPASHADIMAEILARAFAAELADTLSNFPHAMGEINRRNASKAASGSPLNGACASHDFCDSNMSMHAAFQKTFGRDPAFLFQDEGDAKADSDLELWIGLGRSPRNPVSLSDTLCRLWHPLEI